MTQPKEYGGPKGHQRTEGTRRARMHAKRRRNSRRILRLCTQRVRAKQPPSFARAVHRHRSLAIAGAHLSPSPLKACPPPSPATTVLVAL